MKSYSVIFSTPLTRGDNLKNRVVAVLAMSATDAARQIMASYQGVQVIGVMGDADDIGAGLEARESDSVIVPPDMPDAQPLPDAPRDTAARFYQAILDGTESISAIGEQYGPGALVNLFYLLGALAKNDQAGNAAAFIELEMGSPFRQCLDDIKRECPDLAPAIDLGVAQIQVMEF